MSATQTKTLEFSKGALTGDELRRILATYLSVAIDTPVEEDNGLGGAICDLFQEKLRVLFSLNPDDAPCAAMWISDFSVSCAGAAMSEAPPKAIAMIAGFYANSKRPSMA